MAVIKNWNSNVGLGCQNDFGAQFSNTNYSVALAATTDTSLTIPSGSGLGKANDDVPKFLAVFGYAPALAVYVASGSTAAPSLTGAFVANASVLNPQCREVKGGEVLHFYSVAGGNVTVALYAI